MRSSASAWRARAAARCESFSAIPVRSSYTVPELQRMIEYSPLRGVRIFKRGSSHVGFERRIAS